MTVILTLSLTHTATFTVQYWTGREVCVSHFEVKVSDEKDQITQQFNSVSENIYEKVNEKCIFFQMSPFLFQNQWSNMPV